MEKNIFERLLKDGVIDKQKLLLSNYIALGISDRQALLIIRLLEINEEITIGTIVKKFGIKKVEAQDLVDSLIKSKLVRVTNNGKSLTFKLDEIWRKLFLIYYPPSNDASSEVKLNWIHKTLNLTFTEDQDKTLIKWIENNGWKRLISIVNNITQSQISKIDWIIIEKLYKLDEQKTTIDKKKFQTLSQTNWLIEDD